METLSEKGFDILLTKLVVGRGYIFVNEDTFTNVPITVEDFTRAILDAEGFTPGVGGDEFRAVRRIVNDVFETHFSEDVV